MLELESGDPESFLHCAAIALGCWDASHDALCISSLPNSHVYIPLLQMFKTVFYLLSSVFSSIVSLLSCPPLHSFFPFTPNRLQEMAPRAMGVLGGFFLWERSFSFPLSPCFLFIGSCLIVEFSFIYCKVFTLQCKMPCELTIFKYKLNWSEKCN